MARRIRYVEINPWTNPIQGLTDQPFLGEILFPLDPRSAAAAEAVTVLQRFYCAERINGTDDVGRLSAFVTNPDKQMLIIWGDVGIGKTWFVRYEFSVGAMGTQQLAGVIDILGGGIIDAEDAIYRQLCPLLETYFQRSVGSVEDALLELARHRVRNQRRAQTAPEVIEADAKQLVARWLPADYGRAYADRLLAAMEERREPILFIVIDNIDRTGEKEQGILLDVTKRALRHPNLRLIIPLRKSSALLSDRFKGLKEQTYDDMELGPLELPTMLKKRFEFSRGGRPLHQTPIIRDGEDALTFPELYRRTFTAETGDILLKISGKNAREALLLTDRLIHSDHLKGLKNIGNLQYAIAALMLIHHTQLDANYPYVINLFDDNRREEGNALVRFRVLEYLYNRRTATVAEEYFRRYMARLGFKEPWLRAVLGTFVGTGLVLSRKGLAPEALESATTRAEELGEFEISEIGRAYWEVLIGLQWYYVAIKQGVVVPEKYIKNNPKQNSEYIRHSDLCSFFRDEEDAERVRIRRWEGEHGTLNVYLEQPSEKAKQALARGRAPQSQEDEEG